MSEGVISYSNSVEHTKSKFLKCWLSSLFSTPSSPGHINHKLLNSHGHRALYFSASYNTICTQLKHALCKYFYFLLVFCKNIHYVLQCTWSFMVILTLIYWERGYYAVRQKNTVCQIFCLHQLKDDPAHKLLFSNLNQGTHTSKIHSCPNPLQRNVFLQYSEIFQELVAACWVDLFWEPRTRVTEIPLMKQVQPPK